MEKSKRAEVLKAAGLSPKAFCPACWHHVKKLLNREESHLTVIAKLVEALNHAESRLNDIPHSYDDTNFALIREAKQAAEDL